MEIRNFLKIENRIEFRQWLVENHNKEVECWVECKRGKPKDNETFWYLDAVEEALCFGWIDSTYKRLSESVTGQRFSPRKRNSPWTELNKERCRRLDKLGLMTESGYAVFPNMTPLGFVIEEDIVLLLKSNPDIWRNFNSFPELYQRIRIYNIQFYRKRDPKTFNDSLSKFLDNTKDGKMYGEWNDYGRLLDY